MIKENYVNIKGVNIELTPDQIKRVEDSYIDKNLMDKIKTFEEAYNILPNDDKDKIGYDAIYGLDNIPQHVKDSLKRIIIAKVLNGLWTPNWSDSSEHKWTPHFSIGSVFTFSFSYLDGWNTATTVGSRLCFKSEKLSDYFGEQFIDLHESVLTFRESK